TAENLAFPMSGISGPVRFKGRKDPRDLRAIKDQKVTRDQRGIQGHKGRRERPGLKDCRAFKEQREQPDHRDLRGHRDQPDLPAHPEPQFWATRPRSSSLNHSTALTILL